MYSLFSKITEYVFGSEENAEPSRISNERPCAESLEQEHSGTKETLQTCPAQNEDSRLTKSCYGTVTRLYDGAGVINNEIYFTFDVAVGGFRPELGSEVHLDATRESVTSGWKAIRICSFKEWDSKSETGTIETIIGMVENIKGDIIELNDGLSFSASVIPHHSFSPCKGDWVKVDLERFTDETFEIRGVKPLRERTFSGTINSVFHGYGYIDDEVYFTICVCSHGYQPYQGDIVQVTAIETGRGKCRWRATLVEPKRNLLTSQNSPPLGSVQQFMGNRMTQLLSDKEGLVLQGPFDFGEVPMGDSKTLSLQIKNTSDKTHTFKSCSFVRPDAQFQIDLDTNIEKQSIITNVPWLVPDMEIASQEARCLLVKFTAKSLGRVKQLLVLKFDGCEIGRHITSNVVDNYQARLAPMTPYQRNRAKGREAWSRFMEGSEKEGWLIPGERPTRKTKVIFPIKLKQFSIPSDIRRCIIDQDDLSTVIREFLQALTLENYSARFSALLHAEELQMEMDMREFDLQNVTMDICGEFLSLYIPGLAEGRPSLLIGDTVVVSLCDGSYNAPRYEGYIHEVRKDDVLLKFHEDFHNNFGLQACDVTFFFNRSSIRRAHQAVQFAAQLGPQVIFPRKLESKLPVVSLYFGTSNDNEDTRRPTDGNNKEKSPSKKVDILYNSNLNERQRAAVSRILSGQCRPTPYILFGPPGTGKTVTLVEAILQVFHRIPASRILACAPSNSASDLLATRLHRSGFIQEGDMVRLNAFQRGQEIPESIASYCLNTDSLLLAAHYRIIISTCSTSGQLFSLGLRAGHFTHVFIDEAGQATEPECLVPMGLAAGGEGQIILAGDPHQLGPVLRSSVAIDYGLNMSLLERLMSRPLYARDESRFVDHGCYDPLLVTKLVNNYRSHPSLLYLPSALFYHGELRVFADQKMRESLSNFEMLPKNGVPLVFHGIQGDDLREGNSPSWFNPAEAVQVIRYIQGLKNSSTARVKSTDIGVVTPYKKQVEKIRMLLKSVSVDDIKVGSVEEFQGQERPVIIISTVRSDQSHVASDVIHSIGFLSNPKRFNVSITRAQCLLIVIGNPHVLCQDPYWCSLLNYCVMNDVYTGCDLPDLNDGLYQEEFHFAMDVLSRIVQNKETDKVSNQENLKEDQLQSAGEIHGSTTISSDFNNLTHNLGNQKLHQNDLCGNDVDNETNGSIVNSTTLSSNDTKESLDFKTKKLFDNSSNGDSKSLEEKPVSKVVDENQCNEEVSGVLSDNVSHEALAVLDSVAPSQNTITCEPEIIPDLTDVQQCSRSLTFGYNENEYCHGNCDVSVIKETMTSKQSAESQDSSGSLKKCYHENYDVTTSRETMTSRRSADGLKMLLGIEHRDGNDQGSPISDKVSSFDKASNMSGFEQSEQGSDSNISSECSSEHLKKLLGISSPQDNKFESGGNSKENKKQKYRKSSKGSENKHEREPRIRRSSDKTRNNSEDTHFNRPSRNKRNRSKSEPMNLHERSHSTKSKDSIHVGRSAENSACTRVVCDKKTTTFGLPLDGSYEKGDDDDDDLEEFFFRPFTSR